MGIRSSIVALSALLTGLAPATIDSPVTIARSGAPEIHGQADAREVQVVRPPRHNADVPLQQLVDSYVQEHGSQNLERKLVVHKEAHTLGVYLNEVLLKEYSIALGYSPLGYDTHGDKEIMGDGRTPEGEFYVAQRIPHSQYHKALLISYPGIDDAERGLRSGIINQREHDAIVSANNRCTIPPQNTELGGMVEIHGHNDPQYSDWTFGCVALTNEEMDEIYSFSQAGCSQGRPRTRIVGEP